MAPHVFYVAKELQVPSNLSPAQSAPTSVNGIAGHSAAPLSIGGQYQAVGGTSAPNEERKTCRERSARDSEQPGSAHDFGPAGQAPRARRPAVATPGKPRGCRRRGSPGARGAVAYPAESFINNAIDML